MRQEPSRWYESLRALVGRKLGACPRCMRASLGLAAAAWAGYAVALAVTDATLVHAAAVAVAAAFTMLFVAHVAAFYLRANRQWHASGLDAGPEGDAALAQNRRRFFVASGAVLAGALLAPVSRLFGSEVLAASSPPGPPCPCQAPDPTEPKTRCPSCRCKPRGGPPKQPTAPCNDKVQSPQEDTSVKGDCAGSLAGCGGACTLTVTWRCRPRDKRNGKGFHWEEVSRDDTCPTLGAPQDESTTSKGHCNKPCKHDDCGKQTDWSCDPHAGEGNDPKGRWIAGQTRDNPACPPSS